MNTTDILDEIKKLTAAQRLALMEDILRSVRGEMKPQTPGPGEDLKRRLVAAAELLLPDYADDPELTAFTALDSEDFHG